MESPDLEGNLVDEADALSESFNGTLKLDDERGMMRDASSHSMTMPYDIGGKAAKPGCYGVTFEVVNARIVKEGRSKYVLYSVLVVSSARMDKAPSTIEKRYSDFEKLHQSMKKRYAALMPGISFPKKLVAGNYRQETIAQRSRAFEQYLAHIFSIDQLRLSLDFADFFYGSDVRLGHSLMVNGQYQEAIPPLQRAVPFQKKLQGDAHPDVIATLCALVAAYAKLEKDEQAQSLAETALECARPEDTTNKYLVPLLQTSIRLCWKLAKDKKDLEARLQRLKDRGVETELAPSLLELVVARHEKLTDV